MAESFHERLLRLGKAKDYAGVIETLRTPFPAESDASPRDGTTEQSARPREELSTPPQKKTEGE